MLSITVSRVVTVFSRITLLTVFGAVASLLLVPTLSGAKDYYFASSSGKDSNPCTEAQPCKTMTKANDLSLQPGDQVFLKRGDTWTATNTTERINVRQDGTADKPIIFSTYGTGKRPVLDGDVMKTKTYGFQCQNHAHVVVKDIRFTNWLSGLRIHACQHITVSNVEVDHIHGACIGVREFSHDIVIEDSVVHDCGEGGYNGEGFYIGTDSSKDGGIPDQTRDVIIQRNEIYATSHEPIELKPGTLNGTVINNYIHDIYLHTWGAAIVGNSTHPNALQTNPNHLIAQNRVTNITGSNGYGIYCRTGCRIYNNIVDNNGQAGIYIKGVNNIFHPVMVFNNTIYKNKGAAILEEATKNVNKQNNIAWQNGSGNDKNDPLFANVAVGDFRLCEGTGRPVVSCKERSPAIESGVIVGLSFAGIAPDLGALESNVSNIPGPTRLRLVTQQ